MGVFENDFENGTDSKQSNNNGQFNPAPESKAKIEEKTEISQSSRGRKRETYCICGTSRTDGLMIQCEICEEWYHCSCIRLPARQAKKLDNFVCQMCIGKFEISKKTPHSSIVESQPLPSTNVENFQKDDNEDEYFPEDIEDNEDEEFQLKQDVRKRKYRKALSKKRPKKSNEVKTTKRGRKKQENKTKNKVRGRKKNIDKKFHEHRRGRPHSDDSLEDFKINITRQCYGPNCINSARKGSKYCGDECGLKMASKRIMEILPHRVAEWQLTPSEADEKSIAELNEIKKERIKIDALIQEHLFEKSELEKIITKGKRCRPYSVEESAKILENDLDDYTMNCPVCSTEISLKTALRHMDKCFSKTESLTSFGSNYKTKNERGLLCEEFNSTNKTFCKRLRILCPEHTKEPKIGDEEVCGCPLTSKDDLYIDSREEFCRHLRKKCNIHYGWEKVRQAKIDNEIVAQMFKMDELFERENKVRHAMSCRRGLVQLLLHQTKVEDGSDQPKTSNTDIKNI